jgi:hypothetical protein
MAPAVQPLTDYERFLSARSMIEQGGDAAGGIAILIHLSFSAQPPQLRLWAMRYMEVELKTSVDMGEDDETATEAG